MADRQEITFTIDESGNISVEATGYCGSTCTEEIDKILEGQNIRNVRRKGEFYNAQRVEVVRGSQKGRR